mmetsp:Transcript_24299/g.74926  ORF Transcript_24299/g.74926 Transcript_24299/m.74926 type:complete len:274 (+) Transcript_24299:2160-2981(+)
MPMHVKHPHSSASGFCADRASETASRNDGGAASSSRCDRTDNEKMRANASSANASVGFHSATSSSRSSRFIVCSIVSSSGPSMGVRAASMQYSTNRNARRHAPMPADVETTMTSGTCRRKNVAAARTEGRSRSVARSDTEHRSASEPVPFRYASQSGSPGGGRPRSFSDDAKASGRGTATPTAVHPSNWRDADSSRPLDPWSTSRNGATSARRFSAAAASRATASTPFRRSSFRSSSTRLGTRYFSTARRTAARRSSSHAARRSGSAHGADSF